MQIIKQTDKEKMAMYMKMPKKKIAEMLIQCNKVLDRQYGAKVFSPNAVLAVTSDSKENKKESEVALHDFEQFNFRCSKCWTKYNDAKKGCPKCNDC